MEYRVLPHGGEKVSAIGTQPEELVQELADERERLPDTDLASSGRSPFMQRLTAIPGLDIRNGMARVRGSEEKFERVVDLFWRDAYG